LVNIVLVSHCDKLAQGAKELADQMGNNVVQVIAVGGIEVDGEYALGTDAMRIVAAINQVWTPSGVLILVDLGSAVLSAELAIEMLAPERQARCLLSNAPLVEGAVVATLEAGVGHVLEAVNQAAEAACRYPKVMR
jgi:dihydroxyacetone kinase phosphotransfer subunit